MNVSQECFKDYAIRIFVEIYGKEGKCDIRNIYSKFVVNISSLSDLFSNLDDCFQFSEDGRTIFSLLQEDWNLFMNDSDGEKILSSLLLEINSIFHVDSVVKYSDDVYLLTNQWLKLKRDMIDVYRYMSVRTISNDNAYMSAFLVHSRNFEKGSILYRSRVMTDRMTRIYSPSEMGAPDKTKAKAGRANSEGIPVLYLSDSPETTFYECRAIYLDVVSTGRFELKRDLNIVDFSKKFSPFDSIYDSLKLGLSCEKVCKLIGEDLSNPMKRTDSIVEYVPTQFLCEYIRYFSKVDGIAFKSSLCDGINYVIFDKDQFVCKDVARHQIKKFIISE